MPWLKAVTVVEAASAAIAAVMVFMMMLCATKLEGVALGISKVQVGLCVESHGTD